MPRVWPLALSIASVIAVSCAREAPPPAAPAAETVVSARPSAESAVAEAVKTARTSDRAVLIEFGASWCTWCRNFETFVNAPDTAPIISKHFVVLNLIVRERDEKVALEHAGGNALMDAWGGAKSGLPFYVFLDGAGVKIADSNAMPDGGNIGFPAVPAEIAAFTGLITKAAPKMTDAERLALQSYLTRVMPKPVARSS